MKHSKSHETTLSVINGFTAMCLGALFAYNLDRGLIWFGIPPGLWEDTFMMLAYLVTGLFSMKIINQASVGIVDTPAADINTPDVALCKTVKI
ncbi:hypothetical protein IFT48_02950 [Pseudomonas fluorescens]|uniref:hypothetical protein n=1 Tax=Pseudomonas fluorescens TaxID=294 RepID=UPI001930D8BE|nr:hypothetical protein [Pseudomonas fluorescens]MBD8088925.1 hypothetical protein [Pseudomonas fluorescens]